MSFRFSRRWRDQAQSPNPLSRAQAARRQAGKPVLDLTVSNPTQCGLTLPGDRHRLLDGHFPPRYDPNPQGALETRQAISEYYAEREERTDPSDFFITSGTSEGYGHLFKLLCDPGEAILAPRPSYPLLETLASLENVRLDSYPMIPDLDAVNGTESWKLDRAALEGSLTRETRAVLVVQPNNPTGGILSGEDAAYLTALAGARGLALVVDEVFADFPHGEKRTSLLRSGKSLVFTLNGLSKLLGLPQLKLAWIHVDGNARLKAEARSHLEWICDAYLSVGGAPQAACAELLRRRAEFQEPIRERLRTNLTALREASETNPSLKPLWPQGGWCVPVRCAKVKDDETFAVELLQSQGVLVHPGYFFDFETEDVIVLSLLPEPEMFREGLERLSRFHS